MSKDYTDEKVLAEEVGYADASDDAGEKGPWDAIRGMAATIRNLTVATDHHWFKPANKLPEKGQAVVWIPPSGGAEVHGTFEGGVIWLPTGSGMYVYYLPAMWMAT